MRMKREVVRLADEGREGVREGGRLATGRRREEAALSG